jgi:hypothetical protein
MNEWTVSVRCPHGYTYAVPVDITGVQVPRECPHERPQPRPAGRLRMWLEVRRLRRSMRRHLESGG